MLFVRFLGRKKAAAAKRQSEDKDELVQPGKFGAGFDTDPESSYAPV
jgi:hypothetical protein